MESGGLHARGEGVGPSYVAHGDLVVVDLRDVVGKGIAGYSKFVSVEDKSVVLWKDVLSWLVLSTGKDVTDFRLRVLIAGLLDLAHAGGH